MPNYSDKKSGSVREETLFGKFEARYGKGEFGDIDAIIISVAYEELLKNANQNNQELLQNKVTKYKKIIDNIENQADILKEVRSASAYVKGGRFCPDSEAGRYTVAIFYLHVIAHKDDVDEAIAVLRVLDEEDKYAPAQHALASYYYDQFLQDQSQGSLLRKGLDYCTKAAQKFYSPALIMTRNLGRITDKDTSNLPKSVAEINEWLSTIEYEVKEVKELKHQNIAPSTPLPSISRPKRGEMLTGETLTNRNKR